ncbi:MAG TPA: class I SAM-dependent rRNA methyltransferase [Geobacteraceae bacterium]|nr:class I SAM-dependent rRNA methyltransferase [Geobacteraceae bacterium]
MTVHLKKHMERRLHQGHLWVFSNEIDTMEGDCSPGAEVNVLDSRGRFLGIGYMNRNSLITIRLLSRQPATLDSSFFEKRVRRALDYRLKRYSPSDSFRLIYSEGDLLPGLIVDKYGDTLVLQFLTQGMEVRREQILNALQEIVRPRAMVARNDANLRRLEGLPSQVEVVSGTIPEFLEVEMDGIRFAVDVLAGQKTGFYLDQRENRRALAPYVSGAKVLDLFCYSGACSLYALQAGAREVTACDDSPAAIQLTRRNAELNGVSPRLHTFAADAFRFLHELGEREELFDCIILDPPAFAKNRKHVSEALVAYQRLNKLALRLIRPQGILITSCCSYHVDDTAFLECVRRAGASQRKDLRVLDWRGAGYDHPALLGMPETHYLKCAFLQVEDA